MRIDSLMAKPLSTDYYNESFRATLEALIPTYRASSKTQVVPIPPNYGVIYRADFFGLLLAQKVDPAYHWFVMRLNNMFSPKEFNEKMTSYLVPNFGDLVSACATWKATTVIKT